MITCKNICKSFGDNEVLHDINITFEAGHCNLIIGKSGAGKTVLLKILAGLLEPTSGEVWYDDVNLFGLSKPQLRQVRMQVGMLFQGSALFDSISVEQNVSFPLDMFTNQTRKEKLERVNYCLERVGLSGSNQKFPSEISGGMQKRVGIARSIVLKPKYLFCDEPNSGLDPKTSILIDELIDQITIEDKITTIVNTHDMNSVMQIGDRINLLYMGSLAWKGNKKEVLESENEILHDFIFASPFLKQLRETALKK